MDQWIRERLSSCLCFEIPEEMISYINTIRDNKEVDEYFRTLLDSTNVEHMAFLNELKAKKKGITLTNKPQQLKDVAKGATGRGKNKKKGEHISQHTSSELSEARVPLSSKKKTNHILLHGHDDILKNVMMSQGRHYCDCQATKHRLINNCLNCGRIVCEQEGSGSCLFCGLLVCTSVEQGVIDSATSTGAALKHSLMAQNRPIGLTEAVITRNRLLDYDRNSEQRTAVIDDESDYFRVNSVWLSDAERSNLEQLESELHKKKHTSRLSSRISLGFTESKLMEPQLTFDNTKAKFDRVAKTLNDQENVKGTKNTETSITNMRPCVMGITPTFVDTNYPTLVKAEVFKQHDFNEVYNRVQDKEFLEMSDFRYCLSLHQPWASMLAAGIKRHEGRTWYSAHRGLLWIAATAKPVSMETVSELEAFYRTMYINETLNFPKQYPSGCLVGYVMVQGCLPQEEYRKQYPNGECDSPFVFVCNNAQELPIQIPVKGAHKIYILDSKVHQAAVKSLQLVGKRR
ncbi:activating signal cointegrator 1 isoform X2 [Anopheles cruzii]|uniref:activating signal cointegrator 1 isoform X2 n=1 Tax=Anopheles cruzii TaxID=68878 RepID=UPI0022EC5D16|nr:activating signal cointegrator 1 isoform X2 [Anopheles cruzii]